MKIILLLTLSLLLGNGYATYAVTTSGKELLQQILQLSSESLNYSTCIPEDSLLSLCKQAEPYISIPDNHNATFKIRQITVNSYCLKGDIGLAINEASQMYEDAKRLNNKLGIALAYQALGDTYMYTSRYQKAEDAFSKALEKIQSTGDYWISIRILLQSVHASMYMDNLYKMDTYLQQAEKIANQQSLVEKDIYIFYINCYRTYYNLRKKDLPQAETYLARVQSSSVPQCMLNRWIHTLYSHYYLTNTEFEKALNYADSALSDIKQNDNVNEYTNALLYKSMILEKTNRLEEAFLIYQRVNQINDSLDITRYSRQLNALHLNYWVDQVEIENAEAYNRLLKWILLSGISLLCIIILIVAIIKFKSRMLCKSQKQLALESEKAIRSIRSKSFVLSNMSHEIRTPLNAIVGFSEFLASYKEIDLQTKYQCGESIRQNSDLLLKLINDVIDISNLEEGEMVFTMETCDILSICRNVVNTVNEVKQKNLNISFNCPMIELQLVTDRARLQQVLINLLINATKFTEDGGSITLSLTIDKEEKFAIFTVEDTGRGVPVEEQQNIFNRYEKLHEGVQGSGIGLSICRLIVERLGGNIKIDPEYLNGARFIFTHPLKYSKS